MQNGIKRKLLVQQQKALTVSPNLAIAVGNNSYLVKQNYCTSYTLSRIYFNAFRKLFYKSMDQRVAI
jgi:hypothetical protein